MGAEKRSGRKVQAAETTFEILEVLNDSDGMRFTDIAKELDLAKSTVHRYLHTLHKSQYVIKQDSKYHLSLRFLDLGENVRKREEAYNLAKSKVWELAEQTNERAQFIAEEHERAVYVHRKAGSHAVHTDPGLGKREYLHAVSAGKAILAEWPDERIQEYIRKTGLPKLTSNTITDEAYLLQELSEIRERGYSINDQENIEGLRAVGVSVLDEDDVVGALSLSGPSNRMHGEWFEQELPEMLMGSANEIELNLLYS